MDGGGGETTGCVGCVLSSRLKPATSQDTPVRSTEVGVAQSVTEWIHRTVDVTQPVPYNRNTSLDSRDCFKCIYKIPANK